MANYKGKVNVTLFNAVKICLESGNSVAQTAKFMKLSCDVVAMIRDAENLEEYRALMTIKCNKAKQARAIKAKEQAAAEQAAKAAEQAAAEQAAKAAENQRKIPAEFLPQPAPQITPAVPQEVKHTVQVQATRFMEEQMKKQTELLTIICNKLGVIIDDLYGTKEG